ncbi:hypothetical protein CR513_44250, partial [Mucuna pruriens]
MIKKEQEGFKEYTQRWCELAAQISGGGRENRTGYQSGKFAQLSNNIGLAKRPVPEKKKGETNVVLVEPIFP